MTIASVSRGSVLAAIAECDRAGRVAFRSWHGFGPSSAYELRYRRRRYDSKAIMGVAHGYEFGEPLTPYDFSGGAEHSARQLVQLGFAVWRGGERLTEVDVAIPQRLSLRPLTADLRLYVCRPTNARSVAACREHGFGVLLSPISRSGTGISDMSGHAKPIPGLPYVLDNGAWSCHQAGVSWDQGPLLRMLERLEDNRDRPCFVVAPDIIGGGEESLRFSTRWLSEHREFADQRWLLAVQDGITVERVRAAVERHRLAGVFVGGSTSWKWQTVHRWAEFGLDLGVRVHVGRVNTLRRAELCRDLGVSSIDGSSVSRFAVNAPKMARPCDGTEQPARPRDARHVIAERQFQLTLGAPA